MNKVVTSTSSSSGSPFLDHKIHSHQTSSSSEVSSDPRESSLSAKSTKSDSEHAEKENSGTGRQVVANASPLCKTTFNVGFSQLPKQISRKTNRMGFTFNIMVVGTTGLGKSTFLNTLFMSDVYNEQRPGPSIRYFKDTSIPPVASTTFNLTEDRVNLSMTVIDTPGFGEALDNSACWKMLVDEIHARNAVYMKSELSINRQTSGSSGRRLGVKPDPLVHACFYFIPPTGHGLRQVDLEAMRALYDKVNLIPLIAKADTMTVEEVKAFKAAIHAQLLREEIRVYDFPTSAIPVAQTASDASSLAEVKRLRQRQPFAVCTSATVVTKEDGTKVRCRVYPWGTVETDSLEHNDFLALKTLLMRYFTQDLIDVTYTKHYTNYRTHRLTEIMQSANFSLVDGREPLSQLDAEKKAHQSKLDKLVDEMNEVYVEKVREREKRLFESEKELAERVQQMQLQLESEAEDLSIARQRFNEERVSWEMKNRDYADSVCGSMEKLEKIKKHRRGLF